MKSFRWSTLWLTLVCAASLAAALAMAAVLGPPLLDLFEHATHRRLEFNTAIRVYVLLTGMVWLLGFTARTLARPTAETVVTWAWLVAAGAAIAFVCLFDLHHELEVEYSWLRYTTSGCLFAAALLSLWVALGYRGTPKGEPPYVAVWVFMAMGFTYVGLDELCQIHEQIGRFFVQRLHLPHAASDWITLGYGVLALAAGLIVGPRFLRVYAERHRPTLRLLTVGAILFLVSQVLDFTDQYFFPWIRALALRLTTDPPRVLSDTWYLFWAPERTFNDFEEVFENVAAAIFAAAVMVLLFERQRRALPATLMRPRRGAAWATGALLVGGCVAGVIYARPSLYAASPAPGWAARRVLGPKEGILHPDEDAYVPRWGIFVANQGAGNVLVYHDGVARALPAPPMGPEGELDSVTGDDGSIYASTSSYGTIFRYREGTGWEPFVTKADSLKAPEGMAIHDSTLYCFDEDFRRFYQVSLRTRHVVSLPFRDPRCVHPEGVTYHPGLGELLVTDDKQGWIVAMKPGDTLRTFASPRQGLKGPEDIAVDADGHVLASDPDRREIIELDAGGRVLGRMAFSRMYGDVVGVDVVGSGADRKLYVVTGDGSRNDAFVPGALWEVEGGPVPESARR